MNILIISAEVAPFAKVGGLADVAGSLPRVLKMLGHDVRVVMPCYKMVETDERYAVSDLIPEFTVPLYGEKRELAFVKQTEISTNSIPVYLIGSPLSTSDPRTQTDGSGYFQEATKSQKIYTLDPDPYLFFCRAVLEMLRHLDPVWVPDILHCNDWQTGMVPVYQRAFYAQYSQNQNSQKHDPIGHAACLFTIHNLAYQGNFGRNDWYKTGLPESLLTIDGLEFYGQWTFMKGGIQFSDRVNTVSPNYATEIQTAEYGVGLDGLMREKAAQGRLSGILNGIDYDEYDPATDKQIAAHFDSSDLTGKMACKAALQRELGLPISQEVAVIGVVSRLADQKGFDLIRANMEEMLSLPTQFVLLGTGDQNYERYFHELQERYPDQVRAVIAFDIALAQHIYAGSDLFLMPSRFEPCGLGQMFALRYGTLPIVRGTGGLADTITDYDPISSPDGNGFRFDEYSAEALRNTIQRAVKAWLDTETRQMLIRRALACDYSWNHSGERYLELYREAITAHRQNSI